MATICGVRARLFAVPLDEPLVDAKHGTHTHFQLVCATVTLDDGREATGYTYTGGTGGHAIAAAITHDLAPFLLGKAAAAVGTLYDGMLAHLHYVGRGGIVGFAVSAVDIALWDLALRAAGQRLWQAAGGAGTSCRAYAGGIDLGFPLPKLLGSVRGYLDAGFTAVKIKVGQPAQADDVARIKAVRELVGDEVDFMIDANYSLTVDKAVALARAVRDCRLTWFEEPIPPEQWAGYAEVAREGGIPVAQGENLHTIEEFEAAIGQGKVAYIQPDASNCGGITGWLRVVEANAGASVVCSHGMHELHVSLLSGTPNSGWLEVHSFPIDRYCKEPLKLVDHRAVCPEGPGIGVEFDFDRLAPHQVHL